MRQSKSDTQRLVYVESYMKMGGFVNVLGWKDRRIFCRFPQFDKICSIQIILQSVTGTVTTNDHDSYELVRLQCILH